MAKKSSGLALSATDPFYTTKNKFSYKASEGKGEFKAVKTKLPKADVSVSSSSSNNNSTSIPKPDNLYSALRKAQSTAAANTATLTANDLAQAELDAQKASGTGAAFNPGTWLEDITDAFNIFDISGIMASTLNSLRSGQTLVAEGTKRGDALAFGAGVLQLAASPITGIYNYEKDAISNLVKDTGFFGGVAAKTNLRRDYSPGEALFSGYGLLSGKVKPDTNGLNAFDASAKIIASQREYWENFYTRVNEASPDTLDDVEKTFLTSLSIPSKALSSVVYGAGKMFGQFQDTSYTDFLDDISDAERVDDTLSILGQVFAGGALGKVATKIVGENTASKLARATLRSFDEIPYVPYISEFNPMLSKVFRVTPSPTAGPIKSVVRNVERVLDESNSVLDDIASGVAKEAVTNVTTYEELLAKMSEAANLATLQKTVADQTDNAIAQIQKFYDDAGLDFTDAVKSDIKANLDTYAQENLATATRTAATRVAKEAGIIPNISAVIDDVAEGSLRNGIADGFIARAITTPLKAIYGTTEEYAAEIVAKQPQIVAQISQSLPANTKFNLQDTLPGAPRYQELLDTLRAGLDDGKYVFAQNTSNTVAKGTRGVSKGQAFQDAIKFNRGEGGIIIDSPIVDLRGFLNPRDMGVLGIEPGDIRKLSAVERLLKDKQLKRVAKTIESFGNPEAARILRQTNLVNDGLYVYHVNNMGVALDRHIQTINSLDDAFLSKMNDAWVQVVKNLNWRPEVATYFEELKGSSKYMGLTNLYQIYWEGVASNDQELIALVKKAIGNTPDYSEFIRVSNNSIKPFMEESARYYEAMTGIKVPNNPGYIPHILKDVINRPGEADAGFLKQRVSSSLNTETGASSIAMISDDLPGIMRKHILDVAASVATDSSVNKTFGALALGDYDEFVAYTSGRLRKSAQIFSTPSIEGRLGAISKLLKGDSRAKFANIVDSLFQDGRMDIEMVTPIEGGAAVVTEVFDKAKYLSNPEVYLNIKFAGSNAATSSAVKEAVDDIVRSSAEAMNAGSKFADGYVMGGDFKYSDLVDNVEKDKVAEAIRSNPIQMGRAYNDLKGDLEGNLTRAKREKIIRITGDEEGAIQFDNLRKYMGLSNTGENLMRFINIKGTNPELIARVEAASILGRTRIVDEELPAMIERVAKVGSPNDLLKFINDNIKLKFGAFDNKIEMLDWAKTLDNAIRNKDIKTLSEDKFVEVALLVDGVDIDSAKELYGHFNQASRIAPLEKTPQSILAFVDKYKDLGETSLARELYSKGVIDAQIEETNALIASFRDALDVKTGTANLDEINPNILDALVAKSYSKLNKIKQELAIAKSKLKGLGRDGEKFATEIEKLQAYIDKKTLEAQNITNLRIKAKEIDGKLLPALSKEDIANGKMITRMLGANDNVALKAILDKIGATEELFPNLRRLVLNDSLTGEAFGKLRRIAISTPQKVAIAQKLMKSGLPDSAFATANTALNGVKDVFATKFKDTLYSADNVFPRYADSIAREATNDRIENTFKEYMKAEHPKAGAAAEAVLSNAGVDRINASRIGKAITKFQKEGEKGLLEVSLAFAGSLQSLFSSAIVSFSPTVATKNAAAAYFGIAIDDTEEFVKTFGRQGLDFARLGALLGDVDFAPFSTLRKAHTYSDIERVSAGLRRVVSEPIVQGGARKWWNGMSELKKEEYTKIVTAFLESRYAQMHFRDRTLAGDAMYGIGKVFSDNTFIKVASKVTDKIFGAAKGISERDYLGIRYIAEVSDTARLLGSMALELKRTGGDVAQAIANFDSKWITSADFAPAETWISKNLLAFYTWQRIAATYTASALVSDPNFSRKLRLFTALVSKSQSVELQEELKKLPPWHYLRSTPIIGSPYHYVSAGLLSINPLNDLTSYLDITNIKSRFGPQVTTPISLLTGEDFRSGRSIEGEGKLGNVGYSKATNDPVTIAIMEGLPKELSSLFGYKVVQTPTKKGGEERIVNPYVNYLISSSPLAALKVFSQAKNLATGVSNPNAQVNSYEDIAQNILILSAEYTRKDIEEAIMYGDMDRLRAIKSQLVAEDAIQASEDVYFTAPQKLKAGVPLNEDEKRQILLFNSQKDYTDFPMWKREVYNNLPKE